MGDAHANEPNSPALLKPIIAVLTKRAWLSRIAATVCTDANDERKRALLAVAFAVMINAGTDGRCGACRTAVQALEVAHLDLVNLYMYLNGYSCRKRVLRRSATKSSGFTVYPARCSASMIR